MVNSYGSWHDSDDVDSDLEQQAYSLLYYENFNSNTDVTKALEKSDNDLVSINISSNNESEISKSVSDIEEFSINLLNSSDSIIDRKNYSDSDSDDVRIVERVTCSNINGAICIGSSSDDSDYEAMQSTINTTNDSSLQMNFVTEVNNVVEKKSSEKNQQNNELLLSNVDKLFFPSNHHKDDWSVDFQPAQRSRFSNRYFESSSKSVCTICTKKGHTDEQCVRSGPVCIVCGKEGHMSKRCDSAVCFACFQYGHSTKTCPSAKKFLSSGCRRCGQRGHLEEICPDVWRQYKYTVNPGAPVFKRFSSQNKSNVFCANCAKPGHFTEQCPRNRMSSKFLGPPPIMEIIRYDDFDIYQRANLKYSNKIEIPLNDKSSDSTVEFPSFIENMNVTTILDDAKMESDYEDVQESNISQFGDGFIMLSPINKTTTPVIKKPKPTKNIFSHINSSTPRPENGSKSQSINGFGTPKAISKLPGITTELLKKLFPDETDNMEKLPPYVRKKLRKKLKNFLDNGYLPGDSNMTQERMEFWLQEISTGRALNYREKKKLLGSVSAALHSISDRVSSVEIMDSKTENSVPMIEINSEPEKSLSIPEKRKRKNKLTRQKKNLKNSLKLSKKEKQEFVKSEECENSIKSRLRKSSITLDDVKNVKTKKNRKRKRKSAIVPDAVFK